MRKNVTIADFLTQDEIAKAEVLYSQHKPHELNGILVKSLIKPKLERINKTLGQENDPRFLAYAIEYTLMHKGIERPKSEYVYEEQ